MVTAKGRTPKARRTAAAGAGAMRLSSGSRQAGMEFVVSVDPGVLEVLSAQPATVKNLVDRFGKLLARTKRSGQASGFTVMGQPEV